MKVLVVGSGGREYSIGKKISKSPLLDKLYFANGNGGTLKYGENVDIAPTDIDNLVKFALDNHIDLTVVGPENPLAEGIVDLFEENNLKIFGVNKYNSQFESSKDFTKKFLTEYNIPTAAYNSFDNLDEAKEFLKDINFPIVLKADGLAFGKGVFISQNYEDGVKALEEIFSEDGFGDDLVVIEEFLDGKEVSSICLVSHNKIIPLPNVRDFKRIGDNDTGENTGGVGCVCPVENLSDKEVQEMADIVSQIEKGFEAGGYDYTGVLFIGYMITSEKSYVLEFNVRFGDPETELIMEKLESDLLKHILDTLDGTIEKEDLIINDKSYLGIVACSQGYPREYKSGFEITGLEETNAIPIHNATKLVDGKYYTNGGRVLMVLGEGDTTEEARVKAYEAIEKVSFENMYYRKDIR